MNVETIKQIIKDFLINRSYDVEENEQIALDSLDYFSLLLYLEENMQTSIDVDQLFATGIIAPVTTIARLTEHISSTVLKVQEND